MDPAGSVASSEERKYRDDQDEPLKLPNPLLCQRCQPWDNVWTWDNEPGRDDARNLQELSRQTNCLMCCILTTVIKTRRSNSEILQKWPESKVSVRQRGPFFLDESVGPLESPTRVDSTDPSKTIIRLILELEITFLSEESKLHEMSAEAQSKYSDQKAMSKITLTPQFCFHYSADVKPHLTGIEPWEIPFFDVSLLRTWLQGCEAVHGSSCVGKGHVQISKYHRKTGIQRKETKNNSGLATWLQSYRRLRHVHCEALRLSALLCSELYVVC